MNISFIFGTFFLIREVVKNRNILKGYGIVGPGSTLVGMLLANVAYYQLTQWSNIALSSVTVAYWALATFFSVRMKLTKTAPKPYLWWKTAQPIHGDKFIEPSVARITTYDKYDEKHMPTPDSKVVKVEDLKDTLWTIDKDIQGTVYRYWQYSKLHNVRPIEFDISEVVLFDEKGEEIK